VGEVQLYREPGRHTNNWERTGGTPIHFIDLLKSRVLHSGTPLREKKGVSNGRIDRAIWNFGGMGLQGDGWTHVEVRLNLFCHRSHKRKESPNLLPFKAQYFTSNNDQSTNKGDCIKRKGILRSFATGSKKPAKPSLQT